MERGHRDNGSSFRPSRYSGGRNGRRAEGTRIDRRKIRMYLRREKLFFVGWAHILSPDFLCGKLAAGALPIPSSATGFSACPSRPPAIDITSHCIILSPMIEKAIDPVDMPHIFSCYLPQKNAVFIFSSDIAADTWSDWAVLNAGESGTDALALERFIAWDGFKSAYLCASLDGRNAIPSLLRKLFVSALIEENAAAALNGKPLFKRIIAPAFASDSQSLTDWISQMLPQLQLWHDRYEQFVPKPDFDEENSDYLFLYERYRAFLDKNGLFEQAWIRPALQDAQRTFVILYPEILEDFAEYRECLEQAKNVVLIKMPDAPAACAAAPSVYKYADARTELRRTILQIRNLVEQKKAEWIDIALSVPDIETYRPYLERELKNYCVPFVIRSGVPLSANGAGAVFRQIKDCYASDFSFESVRSLLQNEYIPWKTLNPEAAKRSAALDFRILKENLVREGSRMRCLCPYTGADGKRVDVWEASLRATVVNELELRFYLSLKNDIIRLCEAADFDGVRTAWFEFKGRYLAEDDFSSAADNIISRCIVELSALSDIERKYALSARLSHPYDFFLNELASKTYRPQEKINGISVFPYRLAAQSHFLFHFVIDASQKNLSVQYDYLSFLSAAKRRALHIDGGAWKTDASPYFIRLYAKDSGGETNFSYGEHGFSGFAIAHNALTLYKEEKNSPLAALDSGDFIKREHDWLLGRAYAPERLTGRQKDAFSRWQTARSGTGGHPLSPIVIRKARAVLFENRRQETDGEPLLMTITQSDMNNFFPCPRKWLFKTALALKEDSLDTDLMSVFDMGIVNHAVLERFMRPYRETGRRLPSVTAEGVFADESAIQAEIARITGSVICSPQMPFSESALAKETLLCQRNAIASGILDFLHTMLKARKDGGFGGTAVDALEQSFAAPDPGGLWRYFGRIDCVLSEEDSYIIDYKNTGVPKIASCIADEEGALSNFQIPLYVFLIDAQRQKETVKALFFSVRDKKATFIVNADRKGREGAKTPEDFKPTVDAFLAYAKRFYDKAERADFTPARDTSDRYNAVRPFEHCTECSYASICRTLYRIAASPIESTAQGGR